MCAHIQNPEQVLSSECNARQKKKKLLLECNAHREHQCRLSFFFFFPLFEINKHLCCCLFQCQAALSALPFQHNGQVQPDRNAGAGSQEGEL